MCFWDWCELQGQKLRSVPDWICWRRESFGITPEISPSHSIPLSTLNNIQHSGIPNIKNVKSLTDVFLFSISACLFFFFLGVLGALLSACLNAACWIDQTKLSNLGVMTSRDDFVKSGAHLSGEKKKIKGTAREI